MHLSINNTGIEGSDIKSYAKRADTSNFELESMVGDQTCQYDTNNATSNSKQRDINTRLSFITMSHQKQKSSYWKEPSHCKNTSYWAIPKQPLTISSNHRSNCSENHQKYEQIPFDLRRTNGKQKSVHKIIETGVSSDSRISKVNSNDQTNNLLFSPSVNEDGLEDYEWESRKINIKIW